MAKEFYSGTFSAKGTLNPALQDRFGRPKRDISTIIHILNDLLCATPQYRRHARQGHTITVEASTPQSQAPTSTDKSTTSAVDFTDDPSSNLMRENQATRGKVEQLRLIMEERRAKRRARREARAAPYTTQWSAKSETLQQASATEAMDTDSAELNPPGPVVA